MRKAAAIAAGIFLFTAAHAPFVRAEGGSAMGGVKLLFTAEGLRNGEQVSGSFIAKNDFSGQEVMQGQVVMSAAGNDASGPGVSQGNRLLQLPPGDYSIVVQVTRPVDPDLMDQILQKHGGVEVRSDTVQVSVAASQPAVPISFLARFEP